MIPEIQPKIKGLPELPTPHIRVTGSHDPITFEIAQPFFKPHRKTQLFFLYVIKGQSIHTIDLNQVTISKNEVLFVSPGQIHTIPPSIQTLEYFKVTFDDTCLSILPKKYAFLPDPYQRPIIRPDEVAGKRIKTLFQFLSNLLEDSPPDRELLLGYLDCLLTEFNKSYFHGPPAKKTTLEDFMQFKYLIEARLLDHPDIQQLAHDLAMSTTRLYLLVKSHTGSSPKEYLNKRLMLEAQRLLYYERPSIKEVAYRLGFNDPDYFSRQFKKTTGKSVSSFLEDVAGYTST